MASKSKDSNANAKKPFYKRIWFIAIAAIIVIAILQSAMGGGSSTSESATETSTSESTTENNNSEAAPEETQEAAPAEVALEITAKKLVDDLEANALGAKTNYNGKLVKITGTLGTIDASGKYFSLDPDDGFYITSVRVDINEDLIPTVGAFTKGQSVTVTGKITDVGEILGYSVDAISIP
jgi:hypothetical protein